MVFDESPPAWGRGLKLLTTPDLYEGAVAPRVGAWIETARAKTHDDT